MVQVTLLFLLFSCAIISNLVYYTEYMIVGLVVRIAKQILNRVKRDKTNTIRWFIARSHPFVVNVLPSINGATWLSLSLGAQFYTNFPKLWSYVFHIDYSYIYCFALGNQLRNNLETKKLLWLTDGEQRSDERQSSRIKFKLKFTTRYHIQTFMQKFCSDANDTRENHLELMKLIMRMKSVHWKLMYPQKHIAELILHQFNSKKLLKYR